MTSSAHAAQEAKLGSQIGYAQDHHRSTDGTAPRPATARRARVRWDGSGARRAGRAGTGRAGAGDAGEVTASQGRAPNYRTSALVLVSLAEQQPPTASHHPGQPVTAISVLSPWHIHIDQIQPLPHNHFTFVRPYCTYGTILRYYQHTSTRLVANKFNR